MLSIIIPILNENKSLNILHNQICHTIKQHNIRAEIIYIDDGSTDNSWKIIQHLTRNSNTHKGIKLRRNFGKTTALNAGFHYSSGDILLTLDADLQHDPQDIPLFLKKIDEGCDLVCGWQIKRADSKFKVFASRVFNWIIHYLTKTTLHDINCGMKCYRRVIFQQVRLSGEMHRFIVILAGQYGYKLSEVPITSRPRKFGKSKYSAKRYWKGMIDILTITFIARYRERPQHPLGSISILFMTASVIAGLLLMFWFVFFFSQPSLLEMIILVCLSVFSVASFMLGVNIMILSLLAAMISEHYPAHSQNSFIPSITHSVTTNHNIY